MVTVPSGATFEICPVELFSYATHMLVPSKAIAPGVSVSPVYVAVETVGATVITSVEIPALDVGEYVTVNTFGSPVAAKFENVP